MHDQAVQLVRSRTSPPARQPRRLPANPRPHVSACGPSIPRNAEQQRKAQYSQPSIKPTDNSFTNVPVLPPFPLSTVHLSVFMYIDFTTIPLHAYDFT
ncbi:hypothetical protein PHLGIDRAFT_232983 [Phlebiopsis gigantea 11061_1 CR5-6]|uniref:Uncharacterized protein n=1 Tax=Phlebiopsis gigantea (strain 11061_1 CR5-6) TaxID=745531 RepID=A0A0C3S5L3_PHLG1|nr:hypothetical protein PHLGIDRAFT_232983 [Phlebiopsis gigantea 11061_1 CR5-6]